MVGRLDELSAARGALRAPDSTVVVVGGAAGIGKSRFVEELLEHVPEDAHVLFARALPTSIDRALDVVRLLLAADEVELPTVSSAVDALACRSDGPVVIAVDDAHWADPASLDVIDRFLVDAPTDWTLVLTYRPEALTRRLPTAELLHRLERREHVVHVTLPPLVPSEMDQLVESIVGRATDGRAVRALHERTGGNPLFVEELLRAADLRLDPDAALPWTLSDALRSSLDGLDETERRVVEAAAVLGADASWDLLTVVTELEESLLLRCLRRLAEVGLIVEPCDDRFELRHNLLGEAVRDGMLSREVRTLHSAAVDALLAAPDVDAAAVTRHSAAAKRVDVLVAWSNRGARQALADGSTYQALRLAELGLDEEPDHLGLLGVATQAAWMLGLRVEALRHARRWSNVAVATGDADQRAAALRSLIRLSWEGGDPAELDLVDELVALLPDLGAAERSRSAAALAQHHMLSGTAEDATRWADLAEEIAVTLGLDEVALQARLERASAELSSGRSSGREALMGIVDEAEKGEFHVLAARGLFNLLGLAQIDGDLRNELLQRLSVQVDVAGYEAMGTWMIFKLVEAAVAEGELGRARALASRGGSDADVGKRMFMETYLALEAGETELARRFLDDADHPWEAGWGTWQGRVAVAARSGRLDELRRLLPDLPAHHHPAAYEIQVATDVIHELWAAGLPEHEILDFLDLVESRHGGDPPPPDAVLWRAIVAGDVDAALDVVRSTDLAAMPHALASGEAEVALLAHRDGRVDDALELAACAVDRLAGWPGPRLERARHVDELVRTGEAPTGEPGPADALTPRELDVVRQLALGRTNGEVAAALFISPKTVSVHVSNVLGKLEMSSRTEVAAWAIRTGVAPELAA